MDNIYKELNYFYYKNVKCSIFFKRAAPALLPQSKQRKLILNIKAGVILTFAYTIKSDQFFSRFV